ncbi:uncharacterized protein LOC112590001 [Harpegnathos saltator]|uniref:uncharacterized protein LOC112590001 n=1 Tax=Harpegnathos saltator TaxID=610380 RepID=UPI000DBEE1EB|nr:uncharacterized protein LOC112590001 [Harpegnathos saltator]
MISRVCKKERGENMYPFRQCFPRRRYFRPVPAIICFCNGDVTVKTNIQIPGLLSIRDMTEVHWKRRWRRREAADSWIYGGLDLSLDPDAYGLKNLFGERA